MRGDAGTCARLLRPRAAWGADGPLLQIFILSFAGPREYAATLAAAAAAAVVAVAKDVQARPAASVLELRRPARRAAAPGLGCVAAWLRCF